MKNPDRQVRRAGRGLLLGVLLFFSARAAAAEGSAPPEDAVSSSRPREKKKSDELPPVLVLGNRWRDFFAEPALESPGLDTSISVVDREAIEKENAYSVIDALKYVPGAWVERRGRKVKEFFSVRGQRYPYPDYAVDGAWQREFDEMPYFISAANVDRVEVLRSSGALLTGPGGIVGIVNLVPRTHKERELMVHTEYGRFNTWSVHVNQGDTIGPFSYALGAGNRSTEGPRGRNAAENMSDFYGRVAYDPTERLSLSLTTYGLYGRRELEQAKEPAAKKFREDLSRYDPYRAVLVVGKGRVRETDWTATELTLSYSLRDHDFILASESDPAGRKIDEKDYEYGLNLIQVFRLSPENTARVGGLYNRWTAPEGKRFYVGKRNDLHTYSLVVVDEQKLESLTLNAGYRASRTYIEDFGAFGIEGSPKGFGKVEPIEDQWEPFAHNASAGASYYLTDTLSVHSNFAFGQIEPRAGTLDTDMERPERETRYKIDLGVRKTWSGIGTASVTGFYVLRDEAILLSGDTVEIDGQVMELYINRDQVEKGVEIDLQAERFPCGIGGFFNVVFMHTRRENEDGDLRCDREVPQIILSSGLSFERAGFSADVFCKYVSGYENDRFVPPALGPQDLGDFTELNARLAYSLGPEGRWRIFVSGENLTNEKYSTVPGYPAYGTCLYAGAEVRF